MRKEENVKKKKRWKEINTSKVVKVRYLNLDLDLLWKGFGMKLGEIIEDYKTFLFLNFQKKRICFVRVMSFWKLYARSGFLVIFPFFELFGICSFGILKIIKDYICERNFKSFWYLLKEIQRSKVSTLVLKSISFENNNFLWSSSIELKLWSDIEEIYLMCISKSRGVWSCWERVVTNFVFRSQFEVISRK
jgi:hypothetical protein